MFKPIRNSLSNLKTPVGRVMTLLVTATLLFNALPGLPGITGTLLSPVSAAQAGICPATFNPNGVYTQYSGTNTVDIKRGDFNNDGKIDIAAANSSGNVQILIGGGGTNFTPGASYNLGGKVAQVAVADFNSDNKQDIAAVVGGSSQVTILMGNGDGTFQAPANYATDPNPSAIGVGDFNGDGKLDLVTGSVGPTATILIGDGSGHFQKSPTNYTIGGWSSQVVVGNFDTNPALDLAFATIDGKVVSVLLGKGDGTFGPTTNYATGSMNGLAAGDLNGDGKLDLVADGAAMQVLLGNGDGTFKNPVNYPGGQQGVILADMNKDGKLDAVLPPGGPNVWVYLGHGDGTFEPVSKTAITGPQGDFNSGFAYDFNGDGQLDLALVAFSYQTGEMAIVLNTSTCNPPGICPATFNPNGVYTQYNSGTNTVDIKQGSFNNDAFIDIAAANYSGNVQILIGGSGGTFTPGASYNLGGQVSEVAVADFNGDNKQDIAAVVSSSSQVAILMGNGDATFQAPANYATGTSPAVIGVGDFNGDGKLDLVTGSVGPTATILIGDGSGHFQKSSTSYTIGGWSHQVVVGYFDANSTPDVAFATSDGAVVSVLLGKGDGTFGPTTNYATGPMNGLAAGDLNGDGKLDLVASGGTMQVLLGNGDGTFKNPVSYPGGTQGVILADMNNDGKLDAVLPPGGPNVWVYLGHGDGTFEPVSKTAITGPQVGFNRGFAYDFNGDFRLDLALVAYSSQTGGMAIVLNTSTCTVGMPATGDGSQTTTLFSLLFLSVVLLGLGLFIHHYRRSRA